MRSDSHVILCVCVCAGVFVWSSFMSYKHTVYGIFFDDKITNYTISSNSGMDYQIGRVDLEWMQIQIFFFLCIVDGLGSDLISVFGATLGVTGSRLELF